MELSTIEAKSGSDKFLIECVNGQFRLSVEPANRSNGTQSFDGWFPRFFSKPRSAKSALTRFLGESLDWQEANN